MSSGQPQHNVSSNLNIQQAQQPQKSDTQHSTSLAPTSLRAQHTGISGTVAAQAPQAPVQHSQYHGYHPQNSQSFQSYNPQSQPFHAGRQNQLQPQAQSQSQLLPSRTGQTSSQIAQSFQTVGPRISNHKVVASGVKIPKIRLSFLTAPDQAKFEQLFKSAVGDGQALDGDKVRDLLVRSKLPGSDLMHIWVLSDTTKSGQLLFPEFALAMYLCNLKIVGSELPQRLPEKIANEVSSMVDIISFGIPDERPASASPNNSPNFDSGARSSDSSRIYQPQPQPSNIQLLAQLTSQPTGFASQYIPHESSGLQPQSSGLFIHHNTFQNHQAFQQNPQASGYLGPRPSMPPMPTGLGFNVSQDQFGRSSLPLNAQPTGNPGQWGLVNSPASGLPNIDALQQRMMPQPGREGGYTTVGLSGTATVPWAVTKDEKRMYDLLFKAWDGFNKGFIGGDVAIEVMGQSGLEKSDLEKIWTLSDPANKGRLDMDEFAVAMHLIYRKLNGYPVPNRLPSELVPPSTRNFADSIGTVKSLLSQDAEARKSNGASLQSQQIGVSYLKTRSFRTDTNGPVTRRKDATVFRNNDDDVGYKSSARRRLGRGGRTPSPVQPTSPSSELSNGEITIEQLRKKIKEKQILLDAIDFKDEEVADEDDALDRKDRKQAEDLFHRIRRLQGDIDNHPGAVLRNVDCGAERRTLKRQLQSLTDRLPDIASRVRRTERAIAEAKIEVFRLQDAKQNPTGTSLPIGSGPGGPVTEADRLKARARAMMQQRSAALTGKNHTGSDDDASAASQRLDVEKLKIRTEKENNERMIKDVEDSVQDFSRGLENSLTEGKDSSGAEHEKLRWEDGLGVENEVKEFIFDIQRSSRAAKIRNEELGDERQDKGSTSTSTPKESASLSLSKALPSPTLRPPVPGASYSAYKTGEERAAFIKQQAEQRMAERLAALGLKPPTRSGESNQQKQQREAKGREERLLQARADDAQQDEERKRRLYKEQISTPNVTKSTNKKPPIPPSRKSRIDSAGQQMGTKPKADELSQRQKLTPEEVEAKTFKEQQPVQEIKTKRVENDMQRQEDELTKEREAAQIRLLALENQVSSGKMEKKEEKLRKRAMEVKAREKESRLATHHAELEAAKQRERELQLQLEAITNDVSSNDDELPDTTAGETTPTNSQVLSKGESKLTSGDGSVQPIHQFDLEPETNQEYLAVVTEPVTLTAAPLSSGSSTETKNPFFKRTYKLPEGKPPAPLQPSSPMAYSGIPDVSTNPFHRLTQQENATKNMVLLSSDVTGSRPSRVRPEEDEWSVLDSTGESSDDDDVDRPTGGSAKQLASMLFGTMAPPRPMSALEEQNLRTAADVDHRSAPAPLSPPLVSAMGPADAPPPPPPPMPTSGAGSAVSREAPPMLGLFPGSSTAGLPSPRLAAPSVLNGARPVVSSLLGEIARGKGLRKVETKDRSQSSIAGRVLC